VVNTECWVTSIPFNNMNKKEMGIPAIFYFVSSRFIRIQRGQGDKTLEIDGK
jgi:hypothetical protein